MTRPFLFGLTLSLAPLALGAELVITDDAGASHRFAQPVTRLVTLAPHLTEIAFAVGAGAAVVGRDSYSDFPAAAHAVPSIGDAFRLDLERLVAQKPQAVLAWGGGTPAAVIDRIKALGMAVIVLEPKTIDDPARHLELVGALTGHASEGAAAARAYRSALAATRTAHAADPKVRVFYQVNEQPLYTVNAQQPIGQMIVLCGGINPFGGMSALAPVVSEEAVVAADPQVIMTGAGEGGSVGSLERRWGKWPRLAATRNDAFFALDANLVTRPGPRMIEGVKAVCAAVARGR